MLRSSPQLYDELAPTARSLRQFGESTSNNGASDMLISTNKILTRCSPGYRQPNTCTITWNLLPSNVASATDGHNTEGNAVGRSACCRRSATTPRGNPAGQ